MTDRHLNYKVLIIILLILTLLLVIFKGVENKNSDNNYTSSNSVNSAENLSNKEDWILNSISDELENSKNMPYNNLHVSVNNNLLTFPIIGKQLTDSGFVSNNISYVAGHAKTYGDARRNDDSTIYVGYTNLHNSELSTEDCIVNSLQSDNSLINLQIEGNDIHIGDNILDILKILKEHNFIIMYSDNENSEDLKDLTIPYKDNVEYIPSVLNADEQLGTFSLSIITKQDTKTTAYKDDYMPKKLVGESFDSVGYITYMLSGTLDNGLDMIIINYTTVEANEVAYRYDYLQ